MNPKFNCTQAEFYAVAGTGWKSFENNNVAFQALKLKYTALFLADRRAELKIAEELPDEQARYANEEALLVTLREKAKTGKEKWQLLKRYIIDAFPKSLQKITLARGSLPRAAYSFASGKLFGSLLSAITIPPLKTKSPFPPEARGAFCFYF